jgi:endonuclease/exonuclease/phosphatase family metal-dependent hydrolase
MSDPPRFATPSSPHCRGLAAVLFLLLFSAVATTRAQETLRIATFNCEWLIRDKVHVKFGESLRLGGAAAARWNAPGFRDAKYAEAVHAVAAMIRRIDADVIALQEVGRDRDFQELRAAIAAAGLRYDFAEVCVSADTATGQHVAVLSRIPLRLVADAIPGRSIYDAEMDDPETEHDTGISKGMHVLLETRPRPIHLIILHLISEAGGHKEDMQRVAQASVARRYMLPLLRQGEHVIVAGDLNDKRGDPALRRIRGRDDIDEDLIQTGMVEYVDPEAWETRWTYVHQGMREQIDHILLSHSLKQATRRSGGIRTEFIEVDNPLASDHRPVVVTLRF